MKAVRLTAKRKHRKRRDVAVEILDNRADDVLSILEGSDRFDAETEDYDTYVEAILRKHGVLNDGVMVLPFRLRRRRTTSSIDAPHWKSVGRGNVRGEISLPGLALGEGEGWRNFSLAAWTPARHTGGMDHLRPFSSVTAPQFEARRVLDGTWVVRVDLPRGLTRHVEDFKTEQEAKQWIKRDSAAWLKRFEGGRHMPLVENVKGKAKPSVKDKEASDSAREASIKGGMARSAALTPERRSELARVAAVTRWKVTKS
jgi:hypothetical protein